jgi:hypothetical protein
MLDTVKTRHQMEWVDLVSGIRHPGSVRVTECQLSNEVITIPATMIRIAAPRTAIAISPGEYFVSFFAGPV